MSQGGGRGVRPGGSHHQGSRGIKRRGGCGSCWFLGCLESSIEGLSELRYPLLFLSFCWGTLTECDTNSINQSLLPLGTPEQLCGFENPEKNVRGRHKQRILNLDIYA